MASIEINSLTIRKSPLQPENAFRFKALPKITTKGSTILYKGVYNKNTTNKKFIDQKQIYQNGFNRIPLERALCSQKRPPCSIAQVCMFGSHGPQRPKKWRWLLVLWVTSYGWTKLWIWWAYRPICLCWSVEQLRMMCSYSF